MLDTRVLQELLSGPEPEPTLSMSAGVYAVQHGLPILLPLHAFSQEALWMVTLVCGCFRRGVGGRNPNN